MENCPAPELNKTVDSFRPVHFVNALSSALDILAKKYINSLTDFNPCSQRRVKLNLHYFTENMLSLI